MKHGILWKVSHWELIGDDRGRSRLGCTDNFSPVLYEQWEWGCPSFVSRCISITPGAAVSGAGELIKRIALEQGNRGRNSPASGALPGNQSSPATLSWDLSTARSGKCHLFLPRQIFYPCVCVCEAVRGEKKHSQSSSTHPVQYGHGSSALKLSLSPPRDICWVCKRWNWCLHTAIDWEQGG